MIYSVFIGIYFNIILAFTLGSSKCFPSLRVPHQNSACTSPLRHKYYMPCPSHHSLFEYVIYVRLEGVQIMMRLIVDLSATSC